MVQGPFQTWGPCSGAKMDFVQTGQCPELKNVLKQLGKRIDFREIGDKFRVGSSTSCKKGNTADTDENLFRLVPVVGHCARVLPLELVSTNKRQCFKLNTSECLNTSEWSP